MLDKLFYTHIPHRNLYYFYVIVNTKRISLGRLHVSSTGEFDGARFDEILRRAREQQPRSLNVHISDIITPNGKPKDLKMVGKGRNKAWVYTYVNGRTKSIRYDATTRHGDSRYFAELIKSRYDIDEGSISAIIVEHACLHLV